MDKNELDKRFTYHAVVDGQQTKYVAIRNKAREFAELIVAETPESREQSLAITELESVVMWANAAIARRS
ncbi:MAG: hypothetical protein WC986_13695 [Elusimicrobiota bacterium]|jgi:hypothetical protein